MDIFDIESASIRFSSQESSNSDAKLVLEGKPAKNPLLETNLTQTILSSEKQPCPYCQLTDGNCVIAPEQFCSRRYLNWLETPLIGEEAMVAQLRGLGYKPGDTVFYAPKPKYIDQTTGEEREAPLPVKITIKEKKVDKYYSDDEWEEVTEWDFEALEKKADYNQHDQTIERDQKGRKCWIPEKTHYKGFQFLRDISEGKGVLRGKPDQKGQIFILPNEQNKSSYQYLDNPLWNADGGINDDNSSGTYVVFVESDRIFGYSNEEAKNMSPEECKRLQRKEIDYICKNLMISPSVVVDSGNKSLHVYFRFASKVSVAEVLDIKRMLCILMNGDKAVFNPARQMRAAGFKRGDKEQSVVFSSDFVFESPEEFRFKLSSFFPEYLSEQRWKAYEAERKRIEQIQEWDIRKRAKEQEKIEKLLKCPEEELAKKYSTKKYSSGFNGEFNGEKTIYNIENLGNQEAIPLSALIPDKYTKMINEGVVQGTDGREPMLRNLISVSYGYLKLAEDYGINVLNDIEEFGKTYCDNCSPSLDYSDLDRHLGKQEYNYDKESFLEHNKYATPDFFIGKTKKYFKKNNPEEYKRLVESHPQLETVKTFPKTEDKKVDLKELNKTFEKDRIISECLADFPSDLPFGMIQDIKQFIHEDIAKQLKMASEVNEEGEINLGYIEQRIKEDVQWLIEKKIKEFSRYNEMRKLPPNNELLDNYLLEINNLGSGYISDKIINEISTNGSVFIKAGLGSGKTTAMKDFLKLEKNSNRPTIIITHRKALNRVLSSEFGFSNYEDIAEAAKKEGKEASKELIATNKLCISYDSFYKLSGRDFENHIIIFDEAKSGFQHLAKSETLNFNRASVATTIFALGENMNTQNILCIFLDAGLDIATLELLRAKFKDGNPQFFLQESQPSARKIKVFRPKKGQAVKAENATVNQIAIDLKNNLKIAIAIDKKGKALAFKNELEKETGKKIFVFSDDFRANAPEEYKIFLENKDKYLSNFDAFFFTSSLGEGHSIKLSNEAASLYTEAEKNQAELDQILDEWGSLSCYFDKLYGFHYFLPTDSFIQMLGRLRHNPDCTLFISPNKSKDCNLPSGSSDPDELFKQHIESCQAANAEVDFHFKEIENKEYHNALRFNQLISAIPYPFQRATFTYQAIENYQSNNRIDCDVKTMREMGWDIEDSEVDIESEKSKYTDNAKDFIIKSKEDEAKLAMEIYEAEGCFTPDELASLKGETKIKNSKGEEIKGERLATKIKMSKIEEKFPGIFESLPETQRELFYLNNCLKNAKALQSQINLFNALNPEDALSQISKINNKNIKEAGFLGEMNLKDYEKYTANLIKLTRESKILEIFSPTEANAPTESKKRFKADSPEIEQLVSFFKTKKGKDILKNNNINCNKDAIQNINIILSRFSLKLEKGSRTDKNRFYCLTWLNFTSEEASAVQNCLAIKKLFEQPHNKTELETEPKPKNEKIKKIEQTQKHTQISLFV